MCLLLKPTIMIQERQTNNMLFSEINFDDTPICLFGGSQSQGHVPALNTN